MTRNMAIKWLRWILNMFPEDSEQAKALNYSIDSLLVDEAYQLEYEKLYPNQREFREIKVSRPKSAGSLPYYSIRYKEDDEEYEGYGTFDPKILSGYLSKYFFSPFSTDKPPKGKENPCNDCEHRKTWCMGFLCKEALEYLDGEDEDAR